MLRENVWEEAVGKVKIVSHLAKILKASRMTQGEFAAAVGVHPNALYKYRTCRAMPRKPIADTIAAYLGLTVADIWPNYDAVRSDQNRRNAAAVRRGCAERHWPSRQPEYKAQKSAESDLRKVRAAVPVDPNDANAVPMCDDARGGDFRLRPAHTSDEDLQDRRWCRQHAARLHKYLVDHCAWGCYRELRAIMAAENRMAEERARVAQGRE